MEDQVSKTKWGKDDLILQNLFEDIKSASDLTVQQNFGLALSLYGNCFCILSQQMKNLYGELPKDNKHRLKMEVLNVDFYSLVEFLDVKMQPSDAQNPIVVQEEESKNRLEVLRGFRKLAELIWEAVQHADLFLKLKRKPSRMDCILEAY